MDLCISGQNKNIEDLIQEHGWLDVLSQIHPPRSIYMQ